MPRPSCLAYAKAIEEYGAHQVQIEISIVGLTLILSSLQLALRHPLYPARPAPSSRSFLSAARPRSMEFRQSSQTRSPRGMIRRLTRKPTRS